eukprot:4517428-Amphidinium_carterae.1
MPGFKPGTHKQACSMERHNQSFSSLNETISQSVSQSVKQASNQSVNCSQSGQASKLSPTMQLPMRLLDKLCYKAA